MKKFVGIFTICLLITVQYADAKRKGGKVEVSAENSRIRTTANGNIYTSKDGKWSVDGHGQHTAGRGMKPSLGGGVSVTGRWKRELGQPVVEETIIPKDKPTVSEVFYPRPNRPRPSRPTSRWCRCRRDVEDQVDYDDEEKGAAESTPDQNSLGVISFDTDKDAVQAAIQDTYDKRVKRDVHWPRKHKKETKPWLPTRRPPVRITPVLG